MNRTKTLILSISALSLGSFSAIADEMTTLEKDDSVNSPQNVPFNLPITDMYPQRLSENEVAERSGELRGQLENAGSEIRRRQFDPSVFNPEAPLHEGFTDNNADRLSREFILSRDPDIEPYIDEYGRPIQRQSVATQSQNENAFFERIRAEFKPEQSYALRPRQNKAIPLGAGLMNSIETNFTSVAVRTSDDNAIIEIEDGYIYITPNSMEPIGIIVYEDGVLESQVSLLLVPVNGPPAMIDVDIQLTPAMIVKAESYQERLEKERIELQADNERRRQELSGARQSGHTRSIIDTLAPVARGQVPPGFSLSHTVPDEFRHPCKIAIRHETGQRLSGGTEYIDVVIIRNDLSRPYEVREEMCLSEDAKAVAIFKSSYLLPGQETEVYILRDKNFFRERVRQNTRPRLTLGGAE